MHAEMSARGFAKLAVQRPDAPATVSLKGSFKGSLRDL